MNRRSFFSSLAAFAGSASLSPRIFIPKFEPVKWKVVVPPQPKILSCAAFTQFLIDQQPIYDREILKNIGREWLEHLEPDRYDPMASLFKS